MKFSARAAAVALTACAGMAAGASSAAAAAMTPQQVEAAEQAAADTRVPFALPLGGAVQSVTGEASLAGLQGSVPVPVVPPSPQQQDTHSVLPDPLVPPLGSSHGTPELDLTAPLAGGDGSIKQDGLGIAVPQAPLKAVGAAASLGDPITYTPAGAHGAPADEVIDLDRLEPALTAPRLQSSPSGLVTLDQRSAQQPIGRSVQDLLATTTATAQELGG